MCVLGGGGLGSSYYGHLLHFLKRKLNQALCFQINLVDNAFNSQNDIYIRPYHYAKFLNVAPFTPCIINLLPLHCKHTPSNLYSAKLMQKFRKFFIMLRELFVAMPRLPNFMQLKGYLHLLFSVKLTFVFVMIF